MQTNLNLQPYVNDDAKDLTLDYIKKWEFIFKDLESWIVIDVGCGNGRLNTILHKYFRRVIGIDVKNQIVGKYMFSNCEFNQSDFFDWDEPKTDLLVFWGSFNVLAENYDLNKIMNHARSLLQLDGRILIMCESHQSYDLKPLKTWDDGRMKIYLCD